MPPSLAEWKRSQSPAPSQPELQPECLRQSAVTHTLLTNSPEWDTFIRELQALVDEAKRAEAGWLERCGGAVEDKDVRVAQFNYQACKARVATLEEVMALPKRIIEQAHVHPVR